MARARLAAAHAGRRPRGVRTSLTQLSCAKWIKDSCSSPYLQLTPPWTPEPLGLEVSRHHQQQRLDKGSLGGFSGRSGGSGSKETHTTQQAPASDSGGSASSRPPPSSLCFLDAQDGAHLAPGYAAGGATRRHRRREGMASERRGSDGARLVLPFPPQESTPFITA